jgi:hypothetical protein
MRSKRNSSASTIKYMRNECIEFIDIYLVEKGTDTFQEYLNTLNHFVLVDPKLIENRIEIPIFYFYLPVLVDRKQHKKVNEIKNIQLDQVLTMLNVVPLLLFVLEQYPVNIMMQVLLLNVLVNH